MVIASVILSGAQFCIEEHLMVKYTAGPIQILSFEGLWGSIFAGLLVLAALNLDCIDAFTEICTSNGKFESLKIYLQDLQTSQILTLICLLQMVLAAVLNFQSLIVTKISSG